MTSAQIWIGSDDPDVETQKFTLRGDQVDAFWDRSRDIDAGDWEAKLAALRDVQSEIDP